MGNSESNGSTMGQLVHYIIVREDLTLGVLAAMVTHAAGESGALYQDEYDGRFKGATAVVLAANNESHLERIDEYLYSTKVRRVCITESSEPYKGQLMAIGVVPGSRDILGPLMSEFQTLKTCLDNPLNLSVTSSNPNETIKATQEPADLPRESELVRNSLLLQNHC